MRRRSAWAFRKASMESTTKAMNVAKTKSLILSMRGCARPNQASPHVTISNSPSRRSLSVNASQRRSISA